MRFEFSIRTPALLPAAIICVVSAAFAAEAPTNSPDVIWRKFEELTKSESKTTKPKLDAFAEQLRADEGVVAYLVSYGGRISCRHEALNRARAVRRYLLTRVPVNPARIKIIDAGYYDEWVIELWLAPKLAPPLTKTIATQNDGHLSLDKVKLLAKCNRHQRSF